MVASARPAEFDRHRATLEAMFGPVVMVLISEAHLHARILQLRRNRLRLWAETCVADTESCRMLQNRWFSRTLAGGLVALVLLALLWPMGVLVALTGLVVLPLVVSTLLKLAAAFARHCAAHRTGRPMFGATRAPCRSAPRSCPSWCRCFANRTWCRAL